MRSIVPRNAGVAGLAAPTQIAARTMLTTTGRSLTKSGRRDSNSRPLRPKRSALARLSYAPNALERPYSMAVSANQVAIGDLLDDSPPASRFRDDGTHLGNLLNPWAVVPLHSRGVECPATVRAWLAGLELSVPLNHLVPVALLLSKTNGPSALVVLAVVLPTACLAPCLPTVTPTTMEL